jgi:hypothetical protein
MSASYIIRLRQRRLLVHLLRLCPVYSHSPLLAVLARETENGMGAGLRVPICVYVASLEYLPVSSTRAEGLGRITDAGGRFISFRLFVGYVD